MTFADKSVTSRRATGTLCEGPTLTVFLTRPSLGVYAVILHIRAFRSVAYQYLGTDVLSTGRTG